MKILANFEKMRMWSLLLTVLGATMVSCSNILDEEDVDCSVEYRVKFKYDHNMKFADAFANEVRSVTLYAFDQNGKFVYQRTEQGDILGEDGYSMPVEVEAGDYRFITWAGLEGEESFSVPVYYRRTDLPHEPYQYTCRWYSHRERRPEAIVAR